MRVGSFFALWLLAYTFVSTVVGNKQTNKTQRHHLKDQLTNGKGKLGEMLVLSNPSEVTRLEDLLKENIETDGLGEQVEKDDVNWNTLSEGEKESLNSLLKNVATSTISESSKHPKSNILSALRIVIKNLVNLEARLTNQTKQTTSVMKSVVAMKSKCSRALSGLKSVKENLTNIMQSFGDSNANITQLIKSTQSQYMKFIAVQKSENDLMKKEIRALGMRDDQGTFAQQIEQVKSDIDQRLAGLVQQGKGRKNHCTVLDQQAVLLYGMWQNLYKPAEPGSVKVTQATSSSVGWGGVPSRAVDGNKSPVYRNAGCSHTKTELRPWLLLKLQGVSNITGVELTNRGDCCHRRLSNFMIEAYMDDPTTSPDAKGTECYHYKDTIDKAATVLVKCKLPVKGLYVKITILNKTKAILTVCEAVIKGQLLGLISGKPSLQSSVTSVQKGSDKANDGDQVTCSETMADSIDLAPWWLVDMWKPVNVHTVYIRNRNDEQYAWLRNITVTVHMKFPSVCAEVTPYLCATYAGTVGKGQLVTLTCKSPIKGRYLKISRSEHKDGGALSLCEVSVNEKHLTRK